MMYLSGNKFGNLLAEQLGLAARPLKSLTIRVEAGTTVTVEYEEFLTEENGNKILNELRKVGPLRLVVLGQEAEAPTTPS